VAFRERTDNHVEPWITSDRIELRIQREFEDEAIAHLGRFSELRNGLAKSRDARATSMGGTYSLGLPDPSTYSNAVATAPGVRR
jgi:hypothetical protein